jgi:hypothetical protein
VCSSGTRANLDSKGYFDLVQPGNYGKSLNRITVRQIRSPNKPLVLDDTEVQPVMAEAKHNRCIAESRRTPLPLRRDESPQRFSTMLNRLVH